MPGDDEQDRLSEITGRLTAIRDDIAEELTKERPSSTRRSAAPVVSPLTPTTPFVVKDDQLSELVETTYATLGCDPVRVERFIHMLRKKAVRK